MNAVALTHVSFEDLGSLGEVLAQMGFAVQTLDACTTEGAMLKSLDPQLLVVLGGPIGAHDTKTYPFLSAEIALLRGRLAAARPTLGICLGAQLMTAALGAAVYPGTSGPEVGWAPLRAAADAAACPALSELLAPGVQVLHWHGDTFDLPPGVAHLAATARYPNQAYAVGRHALALQFHPEVEASTLERWLVGHACELSAARIDVAQLRADCLRYAPGLEAPARRFWRRWLEAAFAP